MKALLIINPLAGRKKNSPIPEIQAIFDSRPHLSLDIHHTSGPGDATIAAREAAASGYDTVIAAGGDGSIFEVANGLVHSKASLGVIPVGTENVLAREMGIPLSPGEACQHLLNTSPRLIDTGRLDDQHFVCFCGIGFDAHVAHSLPSDRKRRFGALAYFLTSAEKIAKYRKVPRKAKFFFDDEPAVELEFLIIVISNIRSYGGRLIPAPAALIDDGLLDVCIFPQANYLGILGHLQAAKKGKHLELPGIGSFRAKKIRIETQTDEQVQLDGDAWPGNSPFCIEAIPKSLYARF